MNIYKIKQVRIFYEKSIKEWIIRPIQSEKN